MCHFGMLQAFVVVGDSNGHVGLGVKCAKEVATAIRGAIILAKTCACTHLISASHWQGFMQGQLACAGAKSHEVVPAVTHALFNVLQVGGAGAPWLLG